MFQGNLSCAVLGLALLQATAHAALTEIRKDFPHQTKLLAPTAIMKAPSADGSYMVAVYLDQPLGGTVVASLSWTDESGDLQQETVSSQASYAIRVKANTAPVVATTGTVNGSYNLYVIGFGFWTSGSQGQGGITEPISATFANESSDVSATTLLAPTSDGTYFIGLYTVHPNGGAYGGTVTLRWTDEQGPQSMTTAICFNGSPCGVGGNSGIYQPSSLAFPVHVVANSQITIEATSPQTPYSFQVAGIRFGTPSTGSGPLTDYEGNLLNWTNATWPNYKTLVACSAKQGLYLISANIAGPDPNAHAIGTWIGVSDIISAISVGTNWPGIPHQVVVAAYPVCDTQGRGLIFYGTYNGRNPIWGASPTYSLEVDAAAF
jgi:hypothetical protein